MTNIKKYSAVMSAIYSGRNAQKKSSLAMTEPFKSSLLDSSGQNVSEPFEREGKKYYVDRSLSALTAQLNWLALRSSFYSLVASQNGIDVILHPIRSAFVLALGKRRFAMPDNTFETIVSQLTTEGARLVSQVRTAVDPIHFVETLPLFSLWCASKVDAPHDYMSYALELRKEAPFLEARQQLNALEDARSLQGEAEFVTRVNKLLAGISSLNEAMLQRYGVQTTQRISASPIVHLITGALNLTGIAIKLPDPGIQLALPNKVLEWRNRSGFRGIFRNIVRDLTAISSLGKYYDRITSEADRSGGPYGQTATFMDAKTEDVRYLGKAADWKKPM